MHGFLIWIGVTNASGPAYLFWSGFGADLFSYLAVPIILFEYWRRNTCDVPHCHRIAKRKVKDSLGDTHTVCARHIPHNVQETESLAEVLTLTDERPLAP